MKRREKLIRSNSQVNVKHNRVKSKTSSKSEGKFDTMKIEDKLMQKHISSMMKLEQKRKEIELETNKHFTNKPKLSSKTLEITKDSRSLYERQKDFLRKKDINYELMRKLEDDNEMKEFTGVPKINQKSRDMRMSNISQLTKPVKQYHRLMQAPRPNST